MNQEPGEESGLATALDEFSGSEAVFVICGTDTMSAVYVAWQLDGRDLDWRICPEGGSLDDFVVKASEGRKVVLFSSNPLLLTACRLDGVTHRFYLNPEPGIRLSGDLQAIHTPDGFDILSSVPREFAQLCGKGIGSAWDKWRAEHDPEERILKRLSENGG